MEEEKTPWWLRVANILVGIFVIAMGAYALIYPEVAAGTLIVLLAFGLLVIGLIELVRVFSAGISGWQRLLNLILSVIVFLIALAILVWPILAGGIALGWLVAIALIIAGISFTVRHNIGIQIIGVIALVIGVLALVFPSIGVITAVTLVAVGLIILGFALIISGLFGKWL